MDPLTSDAASTLREALLDASPPSSPPLSSQPGIPSSEISEPFMKTEKKSPLPHQDEEAQAKDYEEVQANDYDEEDTETAEILDALRKTYNERYTSPEVPHYTSLFSRNADVESVGDPFYKSPSSIKERFEVRIFMCSDFATTFASLILFLLTASQKTCPALFTFGGTGWLIGTTAFFVVLFWIIFEVRTASVKQLHFLHCTHP